MTTLFQRHLSAEKTLADLREACLKLASELQDTESKAAAYAQAEAYQSALQALQDYYIR